MSDDLGRALALMHGARESFTTARGTLRRSENNGMIEQVVAAGYPETREQISRLWLQQPDLLRLEYDDPPHGPELAVSDGERCWTYDATWGVSVDVAPESHPASDLLDPSPLFFVHRFEARGRVSIAGREALVIYATAPATPRLMIYFVAGVAAHELELAVDVERGILLRKSLLVDGRPNRTMEFVELAFDECFPPETFVFAVPPGKPQHPTPPPDPYADVPAAVEVTVEQAARAASFAVFGLDLPDEWSCRGQYQPPFAWEQLDPAPPPIVETLDLHYALGDGSHNLFLQQWRTVESIAEADHPYGKWEPREHRGQTVWAWTQDEGPPGFGGGPIGSICVEREGTTIILHPGTLTPDQLLRATELLSRIDG